MKRLRFTGRSGLSFISYNLGWWICAFGVNYGLPWLGPATLPILVGLHLYFSPTPWGELLFFMLLAVLGFVVDSALMQMGLFSIGSQVWAPIWLVAMWILLGLTYESMLAWRSRTSMMLVLGAVSGPLTYIWCDAISIVVYARPLWLAIAMHAAIWAALTLPLFKIRDWSLLLARPSERELPQWPVQPEYDEEPIPVLAVDLNFPEESMVAEPSHHHTGAAPPV